MNETYDAVLSEDISPGFGSCRSNWGGWEGIETTKRNLWAQCYGGDFQTSKSRRIDVIEIWGALLEGFLKDMDGGGITWGPMVSGEILFRWLQNQQTGNEEVPVLLSLFTFGDSENLVCLLPAIFNCFSLLLSLVIAKRYGFTALYFSPYHPRHAENRFERRRSMSSSGIFEGPLFIVHET